MPSCEYGPVVLVVCDSPSRNASGSPSTGLQFFHCSLGWRNKKKEGTWAQPERRAAGWKAAGMVSEGWLITQHTGPLLISVIRELKTALTPIGSILRPLLPWASHTAATLDHGTEPDIPVEVIPTSAEVSVGAGWRRRVLGAGAIWALAENPLLTQPETARAIFGACLKSGRPRLFPLGGPGGKLGPEYIIKQRAPSWSQGSHWFVVARVGTALCKSVAGCCS